jgi:hypothetical protein
MQCLVPAFAALSAGACGKRGTREKSKFPLLKHSAPKVMALAAQPVPDF